jgi:hypothetical protein
VTKDVERRIAEIIDPVAWRALEIDADVDALCRIKDFRRIAACYDTLASPARRLRGRQEPAAVRR